MKLNDLDELVDGLSYEGLLYLRSLVLQKITAGNRRILKELNLK